MKVLRHTYSLLRGKSPREIRSILTKSQYLLGRKPVVLPNRDPEKDFPGKANAALLFSADFELAWAFRYSKNKKNNKYPEAMAKRERDNFPFLLDLFDKYQIPVTWATVGHLFLESCRKGDHDRMRRIPHFDNHWTFMTGDWYDHDPCSSVSENNAWYAPDLILDILKAKTPHEIGCHTFSHLNCRDQICPPEVLDDELKACIRVAEEKGIKLKSFVFPGGTFGNYRVLKENGFTCYRRSEKYNLFYPFSDPHGLLVMPSSIGLDDNNLGWSYDFFIRILKRFVDKAISSHTAVHFWFHPSLDSAYMRNVLPSLLAYADEKRQSNELWIGTMGDLAGYIFSKQQS